MQKIQKLLLTFIMIIIAFALPSSALAFLIIKPKTIWPIIANNYNLPSDRDKPDVQYQLYLFLRHPESVEDLTKNAEPYIYHVYEETKRRHLPAELALLPMIESNYKPFTFSAAGAVGLWQLMPGTASGFGVKMNWWYDGRRDTIVSTNVALNYLAYLYNMLNHDWLLAIAAYDAGEGTVLNAIHYNAEHHRPTDFWDLPLPKETQSYVPRLLALAHIIAHPDYYHMNLSPVSADKITSTSTLNKQMNLSDIAKAANISLDTVRTLNPAFRRFATPPDQKVNLTLPLGHMETFVRNISSTKIQKNPEWNHYVVEYGDTLSEIAQKFHTSTKALRHVNSLKSDILHIKQELLVPTKSKHAEIPLNRTLTKSTINEDNIPGPKRVSHTVENGESLWSLAKKHHLKTSQIRFWNNLGFAETIHPGQKLVLWEKPKAIKIPTYHEYKVKPGDNLSAIALHYKTTIKKIKALNKLKSSLLHIGQKLKIA